MSNHRSSNDGYSVLRPLKSGAVRFLRSSLCLAIFLAFFASFSPGSFDVPRPSLSFFFLSPAGGSLDYELLEGAPLDLSDCCYLLWESSLFFLSVSLDPDIDYAWLNGEEAFLLRDLFLPSSLSSEVLGLRLPRPSRLRGLSRSSISDWISNWSVDSRLLQYI